MTLIDAAFSPFRIADMAGAEPASPLALRSAEAERSMHSRGLRRLV